MSSQGGFASSSRPCILEKDIGSKVLYVADNSGDVHAIKFDTMLKIGSVKSSDNAADE